MGNRGTSDLAGFANWQLYIDIDEKTKKSPTLQQFTKQTGIPVEYFEEINSNDEYFWKIQDRSRRRLRSTARSSS